MIEKFDERPSKREKAKDDRIQMNKGFIKSDHLTVAHESRKSNEHRASSSGKDKIEKEAIVSTIAECR